MHSVAEIGHRAEIKLLASCDFSSVYCEFKMACKKLFLNG